MPRKKIVAADHEQVEQPAKRRRPKTKKIKRIPTRANISLGVPGLRGTSVQLQERRAFAARLLSLGLPAQDVVEHLRQKGGIGKRQAQRAVTAAREQRIRSSQRSAQRARADQVDRLEALLYSATVNNAPVPHVVAIEKVIMEVMGTKAAPIQEPPAARSKEALHRMIDEYSDEEFAELVREEQQEMARELARKITQAKQPSGGSSES